MEDGLEAGRADILAGVSRETGERLVVLVDEARRWQGAVRNLVARSTLPAIWTRHIADSLQLVDLGTGPTWVDLGSGGGFPGLVVAIARPDWTVHLVESDSRKCAFLRHAARSAGVAATVHEGRIEAILPRLPRCDTVSARALADLSTLLALSESMLMTGAIGVFPKGRDHGAELTRAGERWRFAADVLPSRTDPDARILRIRDFAGRRDPSSAEPP